MDLSGLLSLIEEMPAYKRLAEELEKADGEVARAAALDAAKPYLIAALHRRLVAPMLIVTTQPEAARRIYENLLAWDNTLEVKIFPEPESLPYEFIPSDTSSEMERLQALSALANLDGGQCAPIIIAPAAALMQKTPPAREFISSVVKIEAGMEIEPMELLSRLQAIGYSSENMVEVPGTFSRRGGIIDIFSSTAEQPARLEFLGNTIESIRIFDPKTQRSVKAVSSVTAMPASELLTNGVQKEAEAALKKLDLTGLKPEFREQFQLGIDKLLHKERPEDWQVFTPFFHRGSLLDYLSKDGLLILDEPQNIKLTAGDIEVKAEELRDEKVRRGELPADFPAPYFKWDEIEKAMAGRRSLYLTSFGATYSTGSLDHARDKSGQAGGGLWHELDFKPAQSYAGQLSSFAEKVREMMEQGQRLVIVSHQSKRLSELFEQAGIGVPVLMEIKEAPPPGSAVLLQGVTAEGWVTRLRQDYGGQVVLLTDSEIFGFIKQRRLLKKRQVPHHKLFVDIKPGEYVVHIEHGIGRLAGVTHLSGNNGEGEKEYLVLEYASGDKLYVPTDQIDRVSRYVGTAGQTPVLSRLGTGEWSRTKRKVKDALEDIAEELITLYAAREIVPGYAYSPDTVWQQEVEGSFPYVETPDQLEVQRQVKEDMEAAKPMDRLVCGDVGYGKTEVAIRAAFKAVMDNKQVAVLVPTTVLAEQHLNAFSQRLSAFPVRIEVLSRFRTPKEQKVVIEGLADGSVDIVIGTHRLLQKDIQFKDLGLLIIDEEQRFGVAHKEYLKQIRSEVDVLTLSATPIPRTLHMSLVGVRDMSVMETPPEERLPVKTYVREYDDFLVREAIIRELERNGQVFFLHNRVQSIGMMAEKLRKLVPEARVAVAHGQMHEDMLEKVMTGFVRGESDVLVCSSIIQSGLDMPNANTLIVNQADKFGLTQLHQLRGRVGRGAELANAYFLYDRGKRLTPVAELRLRTIVEASELGAGFGIAMKDLEIRGAGSLLGMRQSGHISAIGFNLYCQMMSQAVEEQKAKRAGAPKEAMPKQQLPPPTIALPVPAFIPAGYVSDLLTRLELYQKLVKLNEIGEIEPTAKEFEDRFGEAPEEVKNLFYAIRIKILAARASIESITTERGEIVLKPFEGARFDKAGLEAYLKTRRFPAGAIIPGSYQVRLDMKRLGERWGEVLGEVVEGMG